MNTPPTYFPITFTSKVVFKNDRGERVKTYEVGDVISASFYTGTYFVTPMGGIYNDEARRVDGEEQVTYGHKNGDSGIRFRQYAKDALPAWAVDVRLDTE